MYIKKAMFAKRTLLSVMLSLAIAVGPAYCASAFVFSGERAIKHLRAQCEFGPRVPGTPAYEKTKNYLKKELSRWADEVQEQRFQARIGEKEVELTNLIAFIKPKPGEEAPSAAETDPAKKTSWALVCAHWDTRPIADMGFDPERRSQPIPGANDGASGTAVVLELARVLRDQRPSRGVILVLFDGEDQGKSSKQMFLGSRHFAKEYRGPKPEWGVLVDMVGDEDLEIPMEGYSRKHAPAVVERIWQAAEALGSQVFVRRRGVWIMDDHLPLLKAGIPCIAVIDFNYPYWHTLEDTPDKCSADSLQIVGEVLFKTLTE